MNTYQLFGSLLVATFLLAQPAIAQRGNFFAGPGAGPNNTTGSFNTFVGVNAGLRNTSGSDNTLFGNSAGANNTTGNNNTFIGSLAGLRNSTGSDNVFVGRSAGASNTTGFQNAFFGRSAGERNTTGLHNAFFGFAAGRDNSTGSFNAFVGTGAGQSNTTGSFNTFLGTSAGIRNTTGSQNSFLGRSAGARNTTGGGNAFVGFGAGARNTTGGSNAFFGRSAGSDNETGSENSFFGERSGDRNTTGKENTFVGQSAGRNNTTGNGNTYFGFNAGNPSNLSNLSNATAIGHRALVSRSNALVLGSIAGKNGATSDVNVGIGVDAPAFQLHLSRNSAAKPGSGTWTVASDKRLKQHVQAFTDGLDALLQVKPVKYRYNGKAQMPTEKEYVGVIAQEMQEVAPYMVGEFLYQDTTGKEEKYLNYDASALTYILVNAVKEQQQTIQAIREENGQLKQELAQIRKLLSRLPGNREEGNGSVARLWQNAPNPYERTTVIRYFVPPSSGSAAIVLFNSNGQQVSSYSLGTGEGEVTLSSEELAAGTYIYKLIVDGISVDSKKLVLVK
jgi:trimeric autotransporter adhesin